MLCLDTDQSSQKIITLLTSDVIKSTDVHESGEDSDIWVASKLKALIYFVLLLLILLLLQAIKVEQTGAEKQQRVDICSVFNTTKGIGMHVHITEGAKASQELNASFSEVVHLSLDWSLTVVLGNFLTQLLWGHIEITCSILETGCMVFFSSWSSVHPYKQCMRLLIFPFAHFFSSFSLL